MNKKRVCFNCFKELNTESNTCSFCGYSPEQDGDKYPLALPHGSILNGRYILGRVLGQGGFGITYIAQDWKEKKLVAIKEYLPDTMATRSGKTTVMAYTGQRGESFGYGKECFLQEAKTLAEFIGNPNIVNVHSYFEENETAYFVMDYIQGVSFQNYLKNNSGKISWQEAVRILVPIMKALNDVHLKGIIHRDVTPDNIFITGDGTVKLLDFGAARYSLGDKSRSLDVVLKHGFAPKEQYTRHGRQGPYTDIYSVGATFYFAVTGRKPPDSIDRIEEDELILPSNLGIDIPEEIENALLKAMAVQPSDRFASMNEFVEALEVREVSEAVAASVTSDTQVTEDTPKESSTEIEKEVVKNKSSKAIIICAIVACALVIFGAVATIVFFGSEKDKKTPVSGGGTSSGGIKQEETKEIYSDVPYVIGFEQEMAEAMIRENGLEVKVETEYSDTIEAGVVIAQSIKGGVKTKSGNEIVITVSLGIEQVTVPKIIGLSESAAIKKLKSLKLTVGKITYKYDSSKKGTVISQKIKADSSVDKGTKISFVVSKGKKPQKTEPNNNNKKPKNNDDDAVDLNDDDGVVDLN